MTTQQLADALRSASNAFFAGEISGAEQRKRTFGIWDQAAEMGLTEDLRRELLARERA